MFFDVFAVKAVNEVVQDVNKSKIVYYLMHIDTENVSNASRGAATKLQVS